jgi:NhaP-type Na+/H+ or K+/H+ antiporter
MGPRSDVLEGLSFIVYVFIIGVWVLVWAGLGALIAYGRGLPFLVGFIQGALLGPVGVVLMPLLATFRDSDKVADHPLNFDTGSGPQTLDQEYG